MKAAIYIEQGVVQVALTPENQWERNALKLIETSAKVSTFRGEFYQCHGGWYRHGSSTESSLMFLIEKEKSEAEAFAGPGIGGTGASNF